LQARLAGGEYDPTRTRVLHVAANPASELARLQDKAALERLEEENRQLRVALAAAATGSSEPNAAATDAAAAAGGEAGVAAAVATAEVRLLTRKLAAAEKQAGALRDVFKQRVKAFRDSCRCGTVHS
jgi:Mitotic checkpoint protein